jgi:hypothetical protein
MEIVGFIKCLIGDWKLEIGNWKKYKDVDALPNFKVTSQ